MQYMYSEQGHMNIQSRVIKSLYRGAKLGLRIFCFSVQYLTFYIHTVNHQHNGT